MKALNGSAVHVGLGLETALYEQGIQQTKEKAGHHVQYFAFAPALHVGSRSHFSSLLCDLFPLYAFGGAVCRSFP